MNRLALLNIGPDGLILVAALVISALVAVLAWRRVGLAAGIPATMAVAVGFWGWLAIGPNATPDLAHRVVTLSFMVVPSALLLGASRLRWLARHAWALVLLGPFIFVGCYVGICEACVKAGLI